MVAGRLLPVSKQYLPNRQNSEDGRVNAHHHYDVVRKENEKIVLWLEDFAELDEATSRIQKLSSFWPGEYQVIDRKTQQMVARVGPRAQEHS